MSEKINLSIKPVTKKPVRRDFVTIYKLKEAGVFEFLIGFDTRKEAPATPFQSNEDFTENKHSIYMGQASQLIGYILDNKGTKEDLQDAIKYALCIMDARKYRLDVPSLMRKYHYPELYIKYAPEGPHKDRRAARAVEMAQKGVTA